MDPALEKLVSAFIERRENGDRITIEDYCREHPHPELPEMLAKLEHTEALLPSTPAPGRKVGNYEIVDTIGRGGAGTVFRAHDPEGQTVALKLLSPASLLNPRAWERLRREGEALERVRHPSIVRVREFGDTEGEPFVVMDLVEGRPLSDLVDEARNDGEGGLPWDRIGSRIGNGVSDSSDRLRKVVRLAATLARAVSALHEYGILHRDLKPHNIIVDRAGNPTLVDFGLAADEQFATLTKTGDVVGTMAYVAPEQARGERVGEPADVYGLGAILYELITLQPPHEAADSVQLMRVVGEQGARPLRRVEPRAPGALARILYRALAFHVRHRYSTAAALADDLEAFLSGETVQAPRRSAAEWAGDVWRHRRQAALWSLGSLLLIAAVATSVAFARTDDSEELRLLRQDATRAWLEKDADALRTLTAKMRELEPNGDLTEFFATERGADPGRGAGPMNNLLRGVALRHRDDVRGALPLLEQAKIDFPRWAVPTAELARAARKNKEPQRAIREFEIAAALQPKSARLQYELGRAYYEFGDMQGALTPTRNSTRLDGGAHRYWLQLAKTCFALKLHDEGLAAAREAATLSDESERQVLHSIAVLLTSTGEHEEALSMLTQLHADYPDHRDICFSLALVHDTLEHHAEALRYYQVVIDIAPDDCEARLCIANIHAGANREKCIDCQKFFAANPQALDFDRAQVLTQEALDLDRGRSNKTILTAVYVMDKCQRLEWLLTQLEGLRDEAEEDQQIVNLQRAIKRTKSLLSPD